MTIAYYTNVLSPHQLPLAREIVRLVGEENYRYVYRDELDEERLGLGWSDKASPRWCIRGAEDAPELMAADLVYAGGLRPLDLMARRIAAGKKTFYVTERWFKPIRMFGVGFPGAWRMLVPGYRRMARRMVGLLNNPLCRCLAIGPWAKKDMLLLGVKPGQIWEWGYFVEKCKTENVKCTGGGAQFVPLKVLWVGRFLGLKRVDTIIRAVGHLASQTSHGILLDVYGTGPEEGRLKRMARGCEDVVRFHPPVTIDEVRDIMRRHDVYVFASDENEGWGAVVNEALEEGMKVLGTYEAGASAAMLPDDDLFHSGDWRRLAELIARCAEEKREGRLAGQGIGEWTPAKAAERLVGGAWPAEEVSC